MYCAQVEIKILIVLWFLSIDIMVLPMAIYIQGILFVAIWKWGSSIADNPDATIFCKNKIYKKGIYKNAHVYMQKSVRICEFFQPLYFEKIKAM